MYWFPYSFHMFYLDSNVVHRPSMSESFMSRSLTWTHPNVCIRNPSSTTGPFSELRMWVDMWAHMQSIFFIIYFINYLLNQPKTQKLNDQFQKPQHYWTILRLMKRLLVQSLPWFSCGCVKTVHQDSKTAFSSLLKTHSLWDNVITCLNTIDTFWLWNYQQLLYAYFL